MTNFLYPSEKKTNPKSPHSSRARIKWNFRQEFFTLSEQLASKIYTILFLKQKLLIKKLVHLVKF